MLHHRRFSYKTLHLEPHHRYQLEVIFLFVFGFFLFFPYWIILDEYNLPRDPWQWYFFIPWMSFYVLYSLWMRRKVTKAERVTPLKRPIAHWVFIGVAWFSYFHLNSTTLEYFITIDLAFLIFTLFMADSYWDFRKFAFGKAKK